VGADATSHVRPVNPYQDAALTYWAAGWRGVLPLPAGAKDPPPHGWTGADGGYPSYADVWAWREDNPSGNVALRLPDGLIGLDVDAYGQKAGRASLAALVTAYGPLPPTWRSTSRDDGVSGISPFRVPDGLRWPGEAGAGIDIIQRRHRYMVAWPSIHPEGGKYQWLDDLQIPFEDNVPAPDDFPWLPESWIQGLTGGKLERDIPKLGSVDDLEITRWLESLPATSMCRITARALERARGFDSASSRHDAALRSAMHLARLGTEGHAGIPHALASLGGAFCLAVAVQRGQREALDEWGRIVAGAVAVVLADPLRGRPTTRDPCEDPLAGICEPLRPGQVVLPLVPDALPRAQGVDSDGENGLFDLEVDQEIHRQRVRREAKRRLDADEAAASWRRPDAWELVGLLAEPDEPIDWTVKDVLPTGSNVLVTAQFKTGKTTLANHLAACMADGRNFLGQFETAAIPGRVALWNYEVSKSMFTRWLRDLNIENADKVVGINLRGFNMPFTAPAVIEWVVKWLMEKEVTDWIIDPWGRAIVGVANENDNTEVGQVLDILDNIKERAGVRNLIVPTHTGRVVQEQGAERARGATRVDDWADVRWMLTEQEGTRFFRAHGRDVDVPEGSLGFDPIMRSLTYSEGGREPVSAVGRGPVVNLEDRIVAALQAAQGGRGMSANAIVREVKGTKSVALDKIKALASQHVIYLDHDGYHVGSGPATP